MPETIRIVGGGLAGCEAAFFLAEKGHQVELLEMRPGRQTPAHQTGDLGELVCTNSFKSEDPRNAHGQLKREMAALKSLLLKVAAESRVAAGSALAVDRALFSKGMTDSVSSHSRIRVIRDEMTELPQGPTIISSGPLTSDALSVAIRSHHEAARPGVAFFAHDLVADAPPRRVEVHPHLPGKAFDGGIFLPVGFALVLHVMV